MKRDLLDLNKCERQQAAGTVEQMLSVLAHGMNLGPLKCLWNLDQGWSHAGQHRLDVAADGACTKAYFTDAALLAFNDKRRSHGGELQLRRILEVLRETAFC